jgi:hypothetical protein
MKMLVLVSFLSLSFSSLAIGGPSYINVDYKGNTKELTDYISDCHGGWNFPGRGNRKFSLKCAANEKFSITIAKRTLGNIGRGAIICVVKGENWDSGFANQNHHHTANITRGSNNCKITKTNNDNTFELVAQRI